MASMDVPSLPEAGGSAVAEADIDRWAAYKAAHGEDAVAQAVRVNAAAVAESFGWGVDYLVRVMRAYWARLSDANPVQAGSLVRGIGGNLKNLGIMNGRTEADWVKALGHKPVAISALPGNKRLLQFKTGTYKIERIAVVFDATDHRFVKIASRYGC